MQHSPRSPHRRWFQWHGSGRAGNRDRLENNLPKLQRRPTSFGWIPSRKDRMTTQRHRRRDRPHEPCAFTVKENSCIKYSISLSTNTTGSVSSSSREAQRAAGLAKTPLAFNLLRITFKALFIRGGRLSKAFALFDPLIVAVSQVSGAFFHFLLIVQRSRIAPVVEMTLHSEAERNPGHKSPLIYESFLSEATVHGM